MNAKKLLGVLACGTALLALAAPSVALAHCDGMDGPVVVAAQKALADGNVNRILIWIPAKEEAALRATFQKTLRVRKLGPEAKELADAYFFETLVRIHREGEGASYTGVKPAGRDLGPVVPAADKAVADGSADGVLRLVPEAAHAPARRLLAEVLAKKDFPVNDVSAGRRYVAAYVAFMHGIQVFHGGGHCDECERRRQEKHSTKDEHSATAGDRPAKAHAQGAELPACKGDRPCSPPKS